MKKQILIMLAALFITSFAFSEGSQESSKSKDSLEIAFINKSFANPFFEYMRLAVVEMADEEGFTLSYLAPTKPYNLEEQTRLMDDAIAKGVDGIVLVPVDSSGMVPVVERANQAGIPVAVVNTKINGGDIVSFSAIENYDAMTVVAEAVAKELGGKGKVVIIEGTAGNQTAADRLKAIENVISRNPGIEILASQTANFDRAQGMSVMENLIQTYSDIDAVLSCNATMALGAIEALRSADRLNNIVIAGFDMTADAVKAIMDGDMFVTMDQNPEAQALSGVIAVLNTIKGVEVEKQVKIGGVLINASNVDDYKYVLDN